MSLHVVRVFSLCVALGSIVVVFALHDSLKFLTGGVLPSTSTNSVVDVMFSRGGFAALMMGCAVGNLLLRRPWDAVVAVTAPYAALLITEKYLKAFFASPGQEIGGYPSGKASALGALVFVVACFLVPRERHVWWLFMLSLIAFSTLAASAALLVATHGGHNLGQSIAGVTFGSGLASAAALATWSAAAWVARQVRLRAADAD